MWCFNFVHDGVVHCVNILLRLFLQSWEKKGIIDNLLFSCPLFVSFAISTADSNNL